METTYLDLKKLPEEHPLRNTLLDAAKAEYKHMTAQDWQPVVPGRPMAEYTFNDMGDWWIRFFDWRVPQ